MVIAKIFDVRANRAAIADAVRFGRKYKSLIGEMTRRDLLDRHAGSLLGATWSVGLPLIQLAIYVLVFTFIFRGRLGPHDTTGHGYVVYLLAGLVPWLALQEAAGRASEAVTSNAGLVKQIVFPTEVLPLKVALSSLMPLLIGIAITIAIGALNGRTTLIGLAALLPVAVFSYLLFCAGMVYFIGALGVFVKDLREVITVTLSIALFVHPILYTPGQAPSWLRPMFAFSPVSHMIWCFRDALVYGAPTHPWSWLIGPAFSIALFALGWRLFRTLKVTFGNVL